MAKKELLFSVTEKDLEISYFNKKGPGGQHKNKTQNCVRIKHPESGAMTTGQEERSREQNLRNAFRRLAEHPKFKFWINKKMWEIVNKTTIEKEVEKQMARENLKIEVLENDKWVEIK